MSSFESSGWGFGRTSPPPPQEKFPIKRMGPALRKFVKVADIDLSRLHQHRVNIEELRAHGDAVGLQREHVNATRTVQQLQAHVRQLTQMRTQVQEGDLSAFDKKVQGVQKKTCEAASEFLRMYGNLQHSCPIAPPTDCLTRERLQNDTVLTTANSVSTESSPLLEERLLQTQVAGNRQEEVDTRTRESWHDLQKDLTELNGLIHHFASTLATQQEKVDRIEDNIDTTHDNVNEGVIQLTQASKWKAVMLPAFGALIGGAVGGPIGVMAGVKLGGLAAVGGGLIGFTSGTLLKKRKQKIIDMELQNLSSQNKAHLPDLPPHHEPHRR